MKMYSHQVFPLLASGACAACLPACKEHKQEPLNIIYIMSDDHTGRMISAYDMRYGRTPNIDRMATEGVMFKNSFVANSISGPSRACLFTGKHSHINGFATNHDHFDGSQQTMPKLLQAGGYVTAMIGKWHLESTPTGFDHWEILPGQGDYYQPEFITPAGKHQEDGYVTDLITDKSIAWLEARDKHQPFCLFVHHKAPHRNWMPKLEDLYAYENRTFELPDNFYDSYEGRLAASTAEMSIDKDMTFLYDLKVPDMYGRPHQWDSWYNVGDSTGTHGRMTVAQKAQFDAFYDSIYTDLRQQNLSGKELVEWKYQRYLKDYLKTAKSLDDNIGRLLDYLEETDMLENTMIVYTSDQGFYMGEHGWFDKRFMYEESLQTPLVIRLPERFGMKGKTITQMVQNIDHAPTFLELTGLSIPSDIQGESYARLLRGEEPADWRKSIYYHFQEYPAEHAVKRHYGVRTESYKLLHFYNDIDTWEFYDLVNDPSEMHNLIDSPNQTENIQTLKHELHRLQVKYNDTITLPLNN